ncbi:hypothetical protein SmJEL517_g04182 [Synchytrium microbalum]|uniref:Uncharacterized protein n=1 Tax=Synchytrium microbalum TaxID=1806994 RepID=A0A507C089_9FUNG|nr:uncharacterized protein SmJEL517_g04182 [Synchytrium microbalum]TPX32778.1 hypothetical protein SmJEL517_g04182 [Synchytrium microbalum]
MTFTGSVSADQAIAGFVAGATSTLLLHPLDVIKIRLQVDERARNHGNTTINLWKQIQRTEGIGRGLYRGVMANLAGACFSWGLYFWWYGLIKEYMRDGANGKLTAVQHLTASAEAGAACAIVTNPFWVIKTRMCATKWNDPGAYRSLSEGLYKLARYEGINGMYKGLTPALFGVSHGALQFMAYEEMKSIWADFNPTKNVNHMGTLEYITMAAASKLFATICTYPYQVIRSRLQNQYEGRKYTTAWGTITTVYKNEGFTGFYKGLGPNVVRVLPGTMITFAVYEGLSKFFRQYGNGAVVGAKM